MAKIGKYTIKSVSKEKMVAGKGKSLHYIGGNPEAEKKLKSLKKVYKQAHVPTGDIIVRKGLNKKQRSETIKHEYEEAEAIKIKHESYPKAHRRAERDETMPMSKIKAKVARMKKK